MQSSSLAAKVEPSGIWQQPAGGQGQSPVQMVIVTSPPQLPPTVSINSRVIVRDVRQMRFVAPPALHAPGLMR
jgi:hypothetical protein